MILFRKIAVLPTMTLQAQCLEQAYDYCDGIDTKDVLYVALTLQIPAAILITRDVPLYEGLKQRGFEQIALFHEVFDN